MSQPTTARRPVRPRNAANSISEPGDEEQHREAELARASPTKSEGIAQPSSDGPTMMPSMSSNTTIGHAHPATEAAGEQRRQHREQRDDQDDRRGSARSRDQLAMPVAPP